MKNNTRRVVITGMGAVTPLGNSAAELWNAALSGRCGIGRISGFEGERLPVSVAGQVKNFAPKEHGMTILQTTRYSEILDKRGAQGALCGMSADFVKQIFEHIHEESVRQQLEIVNK